MRSHYQLEFLHEEAPNAFDVGYAAEIRAALEDQYNGESPGDR
ncbi:hypothetical protein [Saccharopolyspora kobensis]|nr:hypothetical protein [Saccharopolyspora kobensis]